MIDSDRRALARLAGARTSERASTDDLQGLLLQVVFALLMVFMIAYFIYATDMKREREEQVLDLNRQKLVLALEKTAGDRMVKYGLNALMVQGTDGRRTFDPDGHVSGGRISLAPAAREAFAAGSAAAFADYSDKASLAAAWREEVLAAAGLAENDISPGEGEWLAKEIDERAESLRLDVRGVQRALAARLQPALVASPESLGGATDPNAIAEAVKRKSLELVKEATGAEILP